MRQIRAYGRGGQGVRLACRILAAAFVRAGLPAWAIGGRGDDRPGTPVSALVRVDDRAVTIDDVMVLDPARLDAVRLGGIRPNGVVLVAAPAVPCWRAPDASAVLAIDAPTVAEVCGLGPDIGATMAGAFAGMTGLLALDTLEGAILESHLALPGAHLAACRAGYRAALEPHHDHMAI